MLLAAPYAVSLCLLSATVDALDAWRRSVVGARVAGAGRRVLAAVVGAGPQGRPAGPSGLCARVQRALPRALALLAAFTLLHAQPLAAASGPSRSGAKSRAPFAALAAEASLVLAAFLVPSDDPPACFCVSVPVPAGAPDLSARPRWRPACYGARGGRGRGAPRQPGHVARAGAARGGALAPRPRGSAARGRRPRGRRGPGSGMRRIRRGGQHRAHRVGGNGRVRSRRWVRRRRGGHPEFRAGPSDGVRPAARARGGASSNHPLAEYEALSPSHALEAGGAEEEVRQRRNRRGRAHVPRCWCDCPGHFETSQEWCGWCRAVYARPSARRRRGGAGTGWAPAGGSPLLGALDSAGAVRWACGAAGVACLLYAHADLCAAQSLVCGVAGLSLLRWKGLRQRCCRGPTRIRGTARRGRTPCGGKAVAGRVEAEGRALRGGTMILRIVADSRRPDSLQNCKICFTVKFIFYCIE